MATNYPTALDSFTTKVDNVDAVLASHINDLQSAVVALETKVGVTSSAVSSTTDYKLRNLPAQDSTTLIGNLNAVYLNGQAASYYLNLDNMSSGTLALARGGTGQTSLAGLLGLVYPVGSIYINASVSTNPASLLGFGTWTAFGTGRVLVGVDSGQTEFQTLGTTGGAKTVDASHSHVIPWSSVYSSDQSTTLEEGAGQPNQLKPTATNTGGSSSLSILQPYITVYMWQRTA